MRRVLPGVLLAWWSLGCGVFVAEPGADAGVSAVDAAGAATDAAASAPDAAPPQADAGSAIADAASLDAMSVAPDASTRDGGATPDATAAAPDAVASGAVNCQTPGLLFCEDFESFAPGPAQSARWSNHVASPSNTLIIDDDPARVMGTRSLHVHTEQNQFAYIRANGLAPPNNSFFGRMRAWVTAFPSAPAYAHWTMVEASGDPSNLGVMRPIGGQYDPQGGAADWGIGSDGGPTGDWCYWNPSAPAVAGRWLCLEWEVRASDTSLRVWIDGTFHPELTVDPARRANLVFPSFTRVWFGWWLYQGGPTPSSYDLWIDDLVLSSSRVGCD